MHAVCLHLITVRFWWTTITTRRIEFLKIVYLSLDRKTNISGQTIEFAHISFPWRLKIAFRYKCIPYLMQSVNVKPISDVFFYHRHVIWKASWHFMYIMLLYILSCGKFRNRSLFDTSLISLFFRSGSLLEILIYVRSSFLILEKYTDKIYTIILCCKDLGHFLYKSAQWIFKSLACVITAHILTLHCHTTIFRKTYMKTIWLYCSDLGSFSHDSPHMNTLEGYGVKWHPEN